MVEETQLLIDGELFEGWSELELMLSLDTYSSATFVAPFEPDRREFRDRFRPFTYKPVEIKIGNELLFSGRMLTPHPRASADAVDVTVTAYAMPAVIADCMEPASKLPFEFRNLTLRQVISALIEPFDLRLYMTDDDGPPFDKVALKTDQKVHDFLVDLAQQRGLVLTSTPDGDLLCWKSRAGIAPVARLRDNQEPVTDIATTFNPQEYYSEITGFAPVRGNKEGSKYTLQNPWLREVLRPASVHLQDVVPGDAPTATQAKMARMFGNMVSYVVDVATWRDPSARLWEPNSIVTLNAPSAMVYRETELLIRDVRLKQNAETTSASLGLVLPGSFSGDIPERMPWDE
jgi:prophage tail gpP-like protein